MHFNSWLILKRGNLIQQNIESISVCNKEYSLLQKSFEKWTLLTIYICILITVFDLSNYDSNHCAWYFIVFYDVVEFFQFSSFLRSEIQIFVWMAWADLFYPSSVNFQYLRNWRSRSCHDVRPQTKRGPPVFLHDLCAIFLNPRFGRLLGQGSTNRPIEE